MTIPPLSALVSSATRQEVEDDVLQTSADLGLVTTNWRPGGKVRTIIASVAQKLSDLTTIAVVLVKSGFRGRSGARYASGDGLTLLASDQYGVDRELASAGTTTETLTNATGSPMAFAIGDLHFVNAVSGKTYTNQEPVSVPASGSASVLIQADEAGTASNASPGDISALVTPVIGLSCTNASALVGTDDEDDDSVNEKCDAAFDALSPNGPADAYNFVAKTTAGSDVTRTHLTNPTAQGVVTLYLANASGPSATVSLVNTAIQKNVVPTGGPSCIVAAATSATVNVTSTVTILASANLSNPEVQALVSAALTTYFASIPIGGYSGKLYTSDVLGIIRGAHPKIVKVVMTSPASDVTLAESDVAVLGVVSTTVVQL